MPTARALSRSLLGDPASSTTRTDFAFRRPESLLCLSTCGAPTDPAGDALLGGSKDLLPGAEDGRCAPGFSEPGEERPPKETVSLAGESLARAAESGLLPFCRAMARVKAPPLRAPAGDACPRRIVPLRSWQNT
mmetsp:Transcript_64382/g.102480  ORF Transcript_64382/g.102480 Transcript_64382/m.102480 type:complete len:134 (-) Transcript_64382:16-417(-)